VKLYVYILFISYLILTLKYYSCNYLRSILSVGMAHNNSVKKVSNTITPQPPQDGKKTTRYLKNFGKICYTIYFNTFEFLDVTVKNNLSFIVIVLFSH